MSCDRRCFDIDSVWYKHDDCDKCPGHDCGGCAICNPEREHEINFAKEMISIKEASE